MNELLEEAKAAVSDTVPRTGNPSEWVFSFAAWLTTRDMTLAVGATHNAAPMADLAQEFCREREIGEPGPEWGGVPTP